MTSMNQLGVIPALLIILASMTILHGKDKEKTVRRFILFLMGIGVLLLLVLFITMRFITEPYDRPFFQLSSLLAPSVLGVLALITLNVKELAGMNHKARITAVLLGLSMFVLLGLLWNSQLGVEYLILPGVLVLALGWGLGTRYGWLAITLSLLSLGMFFLLNQLMRNPPTFSTDPPSPVIRFLFLFAYSVIPSLTVVMSAVLMTTNLQPTGTRGGNAALNRSRRMRVFKFGFAFILVIYLAHTIFWGSVWDQTSDGLFGGFVLQQAGIIAIGVGMVMTVTLRGKNRFAGLLFILVAPVLLYQSFETGWRVSYHEITERRAARIAESLAQFYARKSHYPETLQELTPRDLLFIQQPVILAGEEWCYQGGGDYYRLAAFFREFFGSPVSLREYEAAGEPPAGSWGCEERLAGMKDRYYSPMEDPPAMRPPLPTPLPEIEVGMPKTEIQPVLDGISVAPGSWSPDSIYFVFGTQTATISLHFLNGKTGEICTADGQFAFADTLREHHTWLPDGRLLYVDSTGEMVVLTPCQPGAEKLTDRFPETFIQIGAYTPENGLVLLQSKSAYWILDGRTFSLQLIPEVIPNPDEFHWDRFAWLPGGERLAIARLNGREVSNEGSTLYLIAGDTGQVEVNLPLAGDFGQSAPWIEGLSEQELLMHSMGDLVIVDFSTDPPQFTNILADIFYLDIDYPHEVSAAGSFLDKDGNGYYLAVRLNHPRNQATYLYHSETGRVNVYDHEHHTLLLFPDGQLVEMAKQENMPSFRDEYDLVLVDALETVQPQLAFTGHTPREYPHLSLVYLAATAQIAVGSAHGVSLVSLPNGEIEVYWALIGDGFSPKLIVAPDGSALVAAKDFGGLYFIPLPPGE